MKRTRKFDPSQPIQRELFPPHSLAEELLEIFENEKKLKELTATGSRAIRKKLDRIGIAPLEETARTQRLAQNLYKTKMTFKSLFLSEREYICEALKLILSGEAQNGKTAVELMRKRNHEKLMAARKSWDEEKKDLSH